MSTFFVGWWATARGIYEIEAESEEEALKIAQQRVSSGDLNPVTKVIDADVEL